MILRKKKSLVLFKDFKGEIIGLLTVFFLFLAFEDLWGQSQPLFLEQGKIYTLAGFGIGRAGYSATTNLVGPTAISPSPRGGFFLCDTSAHMLYRVDPWGVTDPEAGDGIPGFSGDGGLAINARLNTPTAVVADGEENIYIADAGNHRIRRIRAYERIIETVVGNGLPDNGEEGVPALQAGLTWPMGLALDSKGNLYIADAGSHRIRKVTPDGIISTVAGNGKPGFSGDGGPARLAQLNRPVFLLADSSDGLYVVDQGNRRIRYIDNQGIIRTLVGGGDQPPEGQPPLKVALKEPRAVSLPLERGKLLISDASRVLIWDADDQVRVLVGSDTPGFAVEEGQATGAKFRDPWGIFADTSFRRIMIVDHTNGMLRGLDTLGFLKTLVGGHLGDGGLAVEGKITLPYAVLPLPGGAYLIADTGNHRVRKIAPDGILSTVAGNGDLSLVEEVKATEAGLGQPVSLAWSPDGSWYIADRELNVVWKVTPDGILHRFAGKGGVGADFSQGPPSSNGETPSAREVELREPSGVAVSPQGEVYIAERSGHRIYRVTPSGFIERIAGTGQPGLAKDGDPLLTSPLREPTALAFGPDGRLYVAETGNHRILALDLSSQRISVILGSGEPGSILPEGRSPQEVTLNHPEGLAIDAVGTLFVADTGNHRILKLIPQGKVSVIAGQGVPGFGGDDSWAVEAFLFEPRGLSLDADGNLLIADSMNHRVRLIGKVGEMKAQYRAGDLNGDGRLDLRDVVIALRIAIGISSATPIQLQVGDVAPVQRFAEARKIGDGRITLADAQRLLRRAVGIEPDPWP